MVWRRPFWRIGTKVPALIAAAALFGGAATMLISDLAATRQLRLSIDQQLANHLTTRATALTSFGEAVGRDLLLLTSDPSIFQALQSFVAGWNDLGEGAGATLQRLYIAENPYPPSERVLYQPTDPSLYSIAHERYHRRLRRHAELNGYADLFIIAADGRVLYSVAKADDFATDLAQPPHHAGIAGEIYRALVHNPTEQLVFTDFQQTSRYGKLQVLGAVGRPLLRPDGALIGVVGAVITASTLDGILAHGRGFTQDGQTYLLGTDQVVRSVLPRAPGPLRLTHAVQSAEAGLALRGGSGNIRVERPFAGTREANDIIVGYAPVDLFGRRFALISETSAGEVFAPIESMRMAGLFTGTLALVLLALLGALLARTVTGPLSKSTDALLKLAQGDIDVPVERTTRRDEVGELTNAVVVFRDEILRRQSAEDELRRAKDNADAANRAKSDFLAVMSHEIRTPLHGIIGLLELLRTTPLEQQQQQIAVRAQRSSEALLSILNDVLDFSKIEAGELTVQPEAVDVREMAHSVADAFAPVAQAKQLAFRVVVDEAAPAEITTDPLRLRQILFNLVSNAVKFTDEGRVVLRVSADEGHGHPAGLVFQVADTGIGISEDGIEHLFEPFRQGDPSTSRRYGGTGLGLTISRRLAHLLGGRISVQSALGCGSIFTLKLPPSPADALPEDERPAADAGSAGVRPGPAPEEHAGRAAGPVAAGGADAGGRRLADLDIVVVEDDETSRWLIDTQLARLGCRVRLFASGEEAWRSLVERRPDVLITDYHMPGLTGVELTRRVRVHPPLEGLPVLGLTADVVDGSVRTCLAAGMTKVLIKPLKVDQLLHALDEVLPRTAPSAAAGPAAQPPSRAPADTLEPWPVFDPANLIETFGSLHGEPGRMLEEFIEKTRRELATLRSLAAGERRQELRELAHRLAGSTLSMGALRLGELCRRIERAAESGSPDELPALANALDPALADLARAIGEARAGAGTSDAALLKALAAG